MNASEFHTQIESLSETCENRDLQEYLLALLKIVEENRSKIFTYDLVINMIKHAFVSEPLEFKEEWLKYYTAPDENRLSKKLTNPEISQSLNKSNSSILEPYDFTIEVLKFQIAELHRMKGKELDNEYRYFGIQSETGNSWYNFDPLGNLECGARCMEDNETDFNNLNWSFIGELLENGRLYE